MAIAAKKRSKHGMSSTNKKSKHGMSSTNKKTKGRR